MITSKYFPHFIILSVFSLATLLVIIQTGELAPLIVLGMWFVIIGVMPFLYDKYCVFEGDPDSINGGVENHGGYKKQGGFNFISFDPDKITRIVVVGENGREFEKWFESCEVSLQDGGRTIKIFYK